MSQRLERGPNFIFNPSASEVSGDSLDVLQSGGVVSVCDRRFAAGLSMTDSTKDEEIPLSAYPCLLLPVSL